MLRANILEAARMAESAEDMTAAETAPRPINDTYCFQILSLYNTIF